MASTGAISEQEIRFQLVHAVPGRTRMRVEPPYDVDDLARAIETFLRERPGVLEIRVNRDCQSIVLTYDPDVLRAEDLLAFVEPDAEAADGEGWLSWVRGRVGDATTGVEELSAELRAAARSVLRSAVGFWSTRWIGWLPFASRRSA